MLGSYRAARSVALGSGVWFAPAVALWLSRCSESGCRTGYQAVQIAVMVMVAFVCCVAVALAWSGVRGRREIGPAALVISGAVALTACAPVQTSWSDGCNDHEAQVPLVIAPVALLATPTHLPLAYESVSTLRACPTPGERLTIP